MRVKLTAPISILFCALVLLCADAQSGSLDWQLRAQVSDRCQASADESAATVERQRCASGVSYTISIKRDLQVGTATGAELGTAQVDDATDRIMRADNEVSDQLRTIQVIAN